MNRSPLVWHLNWPLTAVTLLLLPLLVGLGFWQLERAEEKRAAELDFAQLRDAAPRSLEELPATPSNYTNLRVRGEIDNRHTLLIDNRILNGHFGYEVVSPLRMVDSDRLLLVNRGWIAADGARRTLPVVPAINGVVELHGHVYIDRAGFELAGGEPTEGWPRVVPHLDFVELQAALQSPLYPFSLRLDAGSTAALSTNWIVVNLGPEQHVGYAVQWFSLAAVLLFAWLLASCNLWQLLRGKSAALAASERGNDDDN